MHRKQLGMGGQLAAREAYERNGEALVIYLDNPPVNGLGYEVRENIASALKTAIEDPEVKAVVLIGKGTLFCGGADIRQFNTPAASKSPTIRDIIASIEASPKPVVAAIHGVAFGGGLEIALGCHYRIAALDTKFALPEVKLGLLPGAGGTQRLPRLIGVEAALSMITTGDAIGAARAKDLGLVDRLFAGDLLADALAFALGVSASATQHPIVALMTTHLESADEYFERTRTRLARDARGLRAPQECIACVEKSLSLSFSDGLEFERQRFQELLSGVESTALRHLFFAEREAAKVPGLPKGTSPRQVISAGVIGAGTMGTGIAMCFANAGIPVAIVETQQEAMDKGLANIRKVYATAVNKGKLSEGEMSERLALVKGSLKFDVLKSVDLVVEAVFEDMQIKKSVFLQLDAVCKPGCILATNTSRLNINELAYTTMRPQDVIGLHFFSPANVMRLLEVVRGEATSADVIATAMQLSKTIKKIGVLVSVCEGFVGNRMLTPYLREAGFLLEEGASPKDVDDALVRFGMAMGPFTMADMAGLDIGWAARKRQAPTRPAHLRYSAVADRICEMGRFGQKTGAGFYRYEPGSRTPLPDPAIDTLIEQCAKDAGVKRRKITEEEIIQRAICALINEGTKILEEGIAQRASDIDMVYVHGYGFPASRGGPMFFAETVGLWDIYGTISNFEDQHGEFWKPASLLKQLATEGKSFNAA